MFQHVSLLGNVFWQWNKIHKFSMRHSNLLWMLMSSLMLESTPPIILTHIPYPKNNLGGYWITSKLQCCQLHVLWFLFLVFFYHGWFHTMFCRKMFFLCTLHFTKILLFFVHNKFLCNLSSNPILCMYVATQVNHMASLDSHLHHCIILDMTLLFKITLMTNLHF